MNSSPVLLVEALDACIVRLTLNRPSRRNALSIELMNAICSAFETQAANPQRRVVLLEGMGSAFCSGLDLDEAADASVAEESAHAVARLFETVSSSPLITIAMAQGAAFAGGAGLLACCDFAVGADDLKIGFPEVRRGLVPALVAVVLVDRIRQQDLNQMFLLGEPITAVRAQVMGLLDRIVPASQIQDEGRMLASLILKGAPNAVRQTKRWIREMRKTEPRQRFARALELHTEVRRNEEAAEGVKAFLERRAPHWPSS